MSVLSEQIIEELKNRLKAQLGKKLHFIVVYGSAAKGEVAEDSDIDVLVVTAERQLEELVSSISNDLNFENNYKVFVVPMHLSQDEFYRLIRLGSPFLSNVIEEGKVLHDDGTYAGIRGKLLTQSG